MTQCNPDTNGQEKRGRGTGKTPFLSPDRIKSEGIREGDLIGGDSETAPFAVPRPLSPSDDPTALDRFLADNPAMTVRDWKGKGFHSFAPFDKEYVHPGELPWDRLDRDEVRRLATSNKARFLSRGQRMAAGRDPGLIWDERTRSYALRDAATLAPSPVAGEADPYPPQKVRGGPSSRPAAATNKNANTENRERDNA
jgi:hypothetical protein